MPTGIFVGLQTWRKTVRTSWALFQPFVVSGKACCWTVPFLVYYEWFFRIPSLLRMKHLGWWFEIPVQRTWPKKWNRFEQNSGKACLNCNENGSIQICGCDKLQICGKDENFYLNGKVLENTEVIEVCMWNRTWTFPHLLNENWRKQTRWFLPQPKHLASNKFLRT